MGLTEDLHDLVEKLPPQSFELDQLIRRGQSRRASSRTWVAVAGFAAVALVVGGGYALTSGPRSVAHPVQAGTATTAATTPTPTRTPDDSGIGARLTAGLALLPIPLHVPHNARFSSRPAPLGGDTPIYDSPQYFVSWTYNGITFGMTVAHQPQKPDPKTNGCASGSGGACTSDAGDTGITTKLIFPAKHGSKASNLSVFYTALDGTNVIIIAQTGSRLGVPVSLLPYLVKAAHSNRFLLGP